MVFKSSFRIGLVVFLLIMLVFFVTNIFFRDVNYYRTSIVLNAFLLPVLFALVAFLSVYRYKKSRYRLGFREIYGKAFLPMFVGGLLSTITIYIYITYVDPSTKDLLNHQYIESFKTSLEEEYTKAKKILKPESEEMKELESKYAESKIRIQEKEKKNEDMFSARYFSYVFAGYCAYFLLLSLFFGSFFRTKRND